MADGSGVCSRKRSLHTAARNSRARRSGRERSHIHVQYARGVYTILCSGCGLWSYRTCVHIQLYSACLKTTLYALVLHAAPSCGCRDQRECEIFSQTTVFLVPRTIVTELVDDVAVDDNVTVSEHDQSSRSP